MAKKAVATKTTSAKPVSAKAASTKQVTDVLSPSAQPTHEEIAQRAFALYMARGGADGDAMNDWLRAEHELTPRA